MGNTLTFMYNNSQPCISAFLPRHCPHLDLAGVACVVPRRQGASQLSGCHSAGVGKGDGLLWECRLASWKNPPSAVLKFPLGGSRHPGILLLCIWLVFSPLVPTSGLARSKNRMVVGHRGGWAPPGMWALWSMLLSRPSPRSLQFS